MEVEMREESTVMPKEGGVGVFVVGSLGDWGESVINT